MTQITAHRMYGLNKRVKYDFNGIGMAFKTDPKMNNSLLYNTHRESVVNTMPYRRVR
jgi:hypothetical protein